MEDGGRGIPIRTGKERAVDTYEVKLDTFPLAKEEVKKALEQRGMWSIFEVLERVSQRKSRRLSFVCF